jgi:hypothetical protein
VAVHRIKKPCIYNGFINLNTDGHGWTQIFSGIGSGIRLGLVETIGYGMPLVAQKSFYLCSSVSICGLKLFLAFPAPPPENPAISFAKICENPSKTDHRQPPSTPIFFGPHCPSPTCHPAIPATASGGAAELHAHSSDRGCVPRGAGSAAACRPPSRVDHFRRGHPCEALRLVCDTAAVRARVQQPTAAGLPMGWDATLCGRNSRREWACRAHRNCAGRAGESMLLPFSPAENPAFCHHVWTHCHCWPA